VCSRHGCDYRGYGSSIKRQRLDLGSYEGEGRNQRKRPIVQEGVDKTKIIQEFKYILVCCVCGAGEPDNKGHPIVMCHGCPWAFHLQCRTPNISTDEGMIPSCVKNVNKIIILDSLVGHVVVLHANVRREPQDQFDRYFFLFIIPFLSS